MRDETTAQYFIKASAEHTVTKRSVMKERGWFGLGRYQETGRATESEDRETRSQDESIKNLPKGMVEILMSDDTEGTRHGKIMVRPPDDVTIPGFTPTLFPRLIHSSADSRVPTYASSKRAAKTSFTYRTERGYRPEDLNGETHLVSHCPESGACLWWIFHAEGRTRQYSSSIARTTGK